MKIKTNRRKEEIREDIKQTAKSEKKKDSSTCIFSILFV